MIIARASSFNMIIGGCVVAGIAFGTQALFVAVSSEVLPRKYRTWGQAGANTAVALGAIFSLCVAGYLTRRDPNGFRTYFYITAGIYAFSTISCGLLYISPPRELERVYNTRQKLAQLDWPGYIMITSGAVLFCTGLSWAQNPYPWSDAHVLAPFLLGTFILIALCLYSWKIRKDGLLHHDMFRNRNLAISLTAVFIEGLAFMAANVYFSYAVAVLHGDTMGPFDQTLCLMVAFVAFWVAAVVAAYWIYLTKEIRIPGVTTFVMFLIFFIVMSTISPSTPKANFWGYSLFYGTGMGLCLTTFVTAAQFAAPPELIAVTSGLTLSIRALGGGLGLAIFNAIFAHGLSSNLVPKITSAVTKLGLSSESAAELVAGLTAGNAAAVAAIPGVTDAIVAAAALAFKQAYIIAFRYVYVCGGAFSIVGCICELLRVVSIPLVLTRHLFPASAFLINPKAEFTAKIDAPIEVYGEYDVESKLASVDEARVEHVEAARNTGS